MFKPLDHAQTTSFLKLFALYQHGRTVTSGDALCEHLPKTLVSTSSVLLCVVHDMVMARISTHSISRK